MRRVATYLSSLSAWVVQPVLILAILVVGFAAATRLSLSRETPPRSEAVEYAPLVRAVAVAERSLPVVVRGNGTIQARTRIDLVPQVGGEVIEIHPGLRAGGSFRKGETLARIEPVDYELAVARASAEVSAAETSVTLNRAESEAAIEEWNRLNPDEPCPPLVSLEPQIREAEARLKAANAALAGAELDLARTEVTLPFDGRVVASSVDIGQVVMANQPLGVVYATDVFEVPVPLRVGELSWLSLPGEGGDGAGSDAVIRGDAAGKTIEITGVVVRIEGELHDRSRMARVVVEIRVAELDERLAARVLPGTFVDVELQGSTIHGAVELPRAALREDGVVWIVEDGRLRFARVNVVRSVNGAVFVEDLAPGSLVVTSNLEVVTDGMEIRVVDEGGDE